MLNEIFLSRYQVESALFSTDLYSAWRTKDLLSYKPGLLFIYPMSGKLELDLQTFRFRQYRFQELIGYSIPRCQLEQEGDQLLMVIETDPADAPLSRFLPLGSEDLESVVKRILCDLQVCRTANLPLRNLSLDLIWRRSTGEPLYLPPLYLHFPAFSGGLGGGDSAPEFKRGWGSFPYADSYALASLLTNLSAGQDEWSRFHQEITPRLKDRDPQARPDFWQVLQESPVDQTLLTDRERELFDPEEGGAEVLPEECLGVLEEAIQAWNRGRNVLLTMGREGARLARCRKSIEVWLTLNASTGLKTGERPWNSKGRAERGNLFIIDDLQRPSTLLNPLWQALEQRDIQDRFFIIHDPITSESKSELLIRAQSLFNDLPRLYRAEIPVGSGVEEDHGHRLSLIDSADRPMLEILALQDEPITLSLLGQLFPVGESEFYARVARLEQSGELAWRAGVDHGGRSWGLLVEVGDPLWRQFIRSDIDPERLRELHRLSVKLLDSPVGGGKRQQLTLQRLKHLVGAELWSQVASEGMELFGKAIKDGHQLLVIELAMILTLEMVESDLTVAGKQQIYLHLAGQHQGQGMLAEAEEILQRGLGSLTGNDSFLLELIAEPPIRPEIRVAGGDGALAAISGMVRTLADICETRGEFALAVKYLSRLLDAYSEEFSARERGILYNDLAWIHYRLGQLELAVERCEVALRLFDQHQDLLELGQTYNTLGAAQWALTNWAEAETYYKRALALRERGGDENRIAASLNNLGNLYRLTERLPLAIDYFKRSMAIKKRLRNDSGYLISLYNVALISFEMSDLETARNQGLECLELNRVVGNVQLGAEVKGLLGEIAQVNGEHAEADSYLQEAISTCREIEAHTELTTMYRRLIPVQLALENPEAARRTIDEGLRLVLGLGARFEEAQIRIHQADYHLALGDKRAAIESLEKAADILSALDRYEWLARTYCSIGLIQLDNGQELEARECFRRATDIIERRKITALISEWDSLQSKLRQHLGHFTHRIRGEGRERLAGFYQILHLTSTLTVLEELLGQTFSLLQGSFNYSRCALILFAGASDLTRDGERFIGVGDFPDEEEWRSMAKRGGEVVEELGGGNLFCSVPLVMAGQELGFLSVMRSGVGVDEDELDFLNGLARLMALRLVPTTSGLRQHKDLERVPPSSGGQQPTMIGKGRDMQRTFKLITQVKDVDATVLITGESGTGKEEVARSIHFGSSRRDLPFLPVNCASIPGPLLESILFGHERGAFTGAMHRHLGVFEEAGEGTVFLDEIGEMGPEMQAKLLRILQNGQFTRVGGTRSLSCSARILTATNRDLAAEVKLGEFREDLFYRINVLRIHIAPVREKREDLPLLLEHFLTQACEDQGIALKKFSREVMELFLRHPWPGNIRQIKNVISSCVILSRGIVIQNEDLPEDFLEDEWSLQTGQTLDEMAEFLVRAGDYSEERPLEEPLLVALAKRMVLQVDNKAKAARLLGISKPTLYQRLKRYDILTKRGE